MLTQRFPLSVIEASLLPPDEWTPFPAITDRDAWTSLASTPLRKQQRDVIMKQAEEFVNQPIAPITASMYLQYSRTGNRGIIDSASFKRRGILSTLVLAECFEDTGRFLDAILDMAWAITEEATWSVSAHVMTIPGGPASSLPRQDRHTVDLFACETACVLAECLYLIRARLAPEKQALIDRIESEVEKRIIDEVLAHEDFWWYRGHNNWTPWCLSNIIGAAFYTLRDLKKLSKLTAKCFTVMDKFITHYADDGGCDEGPGYWNVSPGAMFIFLEFLHSRTAGKISIYDQPKIRKMADFTIDTHLDGQWVINFADASAGVAVRPGLLGRIGERFNDPRFSEYVHAWRRGFKRGGPIVNPLCSWPCGGVVTHYLRDFFWTSPDSPDVGVSKKLTALYPLTQVVVSRQTTQAEKGLVFAGKAGHNAENHNHNDVGQFILWIDGQPGIVDAGVEAYTRKTFSPERYTIWCIRASGHNPPTIGGIEQVNGIDRRATDVKFEDTPERTSLHAAIHDAYPAEAGLARLTRTMTLDRTSETFTVSDAYTFAKTALPLAVLLWTRDEPTLGRGVVTIPSGPRGLAMSFDEKEVAVSITTQSLAASSLRNMWGPQLYGIVIHHEPTGLAGKYTLRFRPKA